MTKEALEKEAEKHADGIYHYKINVSDYGEDGIINYRYSDVKEAYIKGAEPREKQIQIDAEQIRALQKQNGELTDELALTNKECKDMRKELKQRIRENQKLCEQIEKMKCCENCKYNSYWGNELHCNYGLKEALQEDKLVECKNMDKWEIREK